jgi:hypothetical protein
MALLLLCVPIQLKAYEITVESLEKEKKKNN